jgi:hypothetical protein
MGKEGLTEQKERPEQKLSVIRDENGRILRFEVENPWRAMLGYTLGFFVGFFKDAGVTERVLIPYAGNDVAGYFLNPGEFNVQYDGNCIKIPRKAFTAVVEPFQPETDSDFGSEVYMTYSPENN